MKALTIPEVLVALKMSRNTLYEEIGAGRLRTYTVGRRRYSSDEAVEEYIRAREAEFQAGAGAR